MRIFTKLLLILLFVLSCPAFAQKGGLSGILADSLHSPINYASVAVFDLRDSSVVNFGLSDDEGAFELGRLPAGVPLRLLVSHLMYHPYIVNFKLDSSEIKMLDTLRLNEKHNELSEAVITWEAPPIVVRNDTVEFNADAFVGRPGSAVEELLKRIPGIEIGEDGSVTYNGRKVSKMTIDSKQFFGDDPVILMKNIPAKAIEKVQVTEEKDERGRATETGAVSINLTLKHWAKKSHFGKAYAGYGTDQRYEAGAMWNFLRDTLQITVIGYGNNLSQTGFSFNELYNMGGFERTGLNSVSFSENSVSLNGASFGGGKGITESGGGGFNFNYDVPLKWSVASSYFIGFTRTTFQQELESKRYFADTVLSSNSLTQELIKRSNHAFNARIKWTPDTLNMFYWTPRLTLNGSANNNALINNNSYSEFSNGSYINNRLIGDNQAYNASNNLYWNIKLKRWEYSVSGSQSLNGESGLKDNFIFTEQYSDTAASLVLSQFQERNNENKSFSLTNDASVRYHVNDSLSIFLSQEYNQTESDRQVSVFERDTTTLEQVFLPALSTRFKESREEYRTSLSFRQRIKKSVFSFSIDATSLDLRLNNALTEIPLNRNFQYAEVVASYSKNTMTGYADIDYSYSTEIPNSTQLLDLTDNSNPNRVQMGNPNLSPEKVHELATWTRKKTKNGKLGFYFSGRLNMTENAITMESFFDESGRSVLRPRNFAQGQNKYYAGMSASVFGNWDGKKKWSHRPAINFGANGSRSWQYLNLSAYQTETNIFWVSTSHTLVKKDYLDARVSVYSSWNKAQTLGLSETILNRYTSFNAELWWAPHEKYWLEIKGVHTLQSSSNTAIEGRQFTLLNAAFTRLVLKENRGQIRLSVFDLLNQNRAISQVIEANYVGTSTSNAVTRYAMLSFVYNFNSFQKTGRQQRGFSFW